MQGNGVIDARLHWIYGDGQVVLVGDMVDRGRNVLPLLWLVYRIEAEAKAAGGALHDVLRNHEQKLLILGAAELVRHQTLRGCPDFQVSVEPGPLRPEPFLDSLLADGLAAIKPDYFRGRRP